MLSAVDVIMIAAAGVFVGGSVGTFVGIPVDVSVDCIIDGTFVGESVGDAGAALSTGFVRDPMSRY